MVAHMGCDAYENFCKTAKTSSKCSVSFTSNAFFALTLFSLGSIPAGNRANQTKATPYRSSQRVNIPWLF